MATVAEAAAAIALVAELVALVAAFVALVDAAVALDAALVASAGDPTYASEFHAVEPSPTFIFDVFVSNPISPAFNTGLSSVHCALVPRRCCILTAMTRSSRVELG